MVTASHVKVCINIVFNCTKSTAICPCISIYEAIDAENLLSEIFAVM